MAKNNKKRNSLLFLLCVSTGIVVFTLSPNKAMGQSSIQTSFNLAQATETVTSESGERIDQWLLKERIVIINQEIDDDLAKTVIAQLLYLDLQKPGKDIYLYINSPGGEVSSGIAIYDTMRSLQSDVVTVSVGQSSSMASILLAGGKKGKRFALPNSRIMIHQPSNYNAGGQATEVEIAAKEILYRKNQLNHWLADFTGQPLKRIETDTERDFYMSAQEALAYGIVDKVVNRLPSSSQPCSSQ